MKILIKSVVLLFTGGCLLTGASLIISDETFFPEYNQPDKEKKTEKFIVAFKNSSNFNRPGFSRLPLMAQAEENNIFIHRNIGNDYKNVFLDEKVELFYSGDTHVPYILKANDSIMIQNAQSPNSPLPYSLSANDRVRSNEIRFFEEATNAKIPLLFWEQGNNIKGLIKRSKVENNLPELMNLFKQANLFIQTYTSEKEVSHEFNSFIREYIRFDHYIKLFTYVTKAKTLDSLIISRYFNFQRHESNTYTNANYAYLGALYQLLQYNLKKKKTLTLDLVYTTCDSLFNQKSASLIKYIYINNKFDSLYLKNSQNLQQKISIINENGYRKILQQKFQDVNLIRSSKNLIINVAGNTYTLDEVISFSKKKLVYIDFWASWCVPCRDEFKNYHALKQQLDTSLIDFVFISIDKSKMAWQRASQQEKLDLEPFNFLYLSPSDNELKKLNLRTIPRYILYHNGKLLSNNAPRPSEPALVPLLKKYEGK